MKKTIIIIICLLSLSICAYTTEIFLPSYCTSIIAEDDKLAINDSSLFNELFASTPDERFSILVMHDTITNERIRKLKDIRGMSTLYNLLGVLSVATTAHALFAVPLAPLTHIYDFALVSSSAHLAHTSFWASSYIAAQADKVQKMPITIIIQNNTDNEMCINDMQRGLTWYIREHGQVALSVGNPEINSFRIAEVNQTGQKICYVSIVACNYFKSYELEFEDEEYYYLDREETYNKSEHIISYLRRNKTTNETIVIHPTNKELHQLKKGRLK